MSNFTINIDTQKYCTCYNKPKHDWIFCPYCGKPIFKHYSTTSTSPSDWDTIQWAFTASG